MCVCVCVCVCVHACVRVCVRTRACACAHRSLPVVCLGGRGGAAHGDGGGAGPRVGEGAVMAEQRLINVAVLVASAPLLVSCILSLKRLQKGGLRGGDGARAARDGHPLTNKSSNTNMMMCDVWCYHFLCGGSRGTALECTQVAFTS